MVTHEHCGRAQVWVSSRQHRRQHLAAHVEIIIAEKERDDFFNQALKSPNFVTGTEKLAANYFTSDVLNLVDADHLLTAADPNNFAALIAMVSEKQITSRVAKDLLPEVVFSGADPLKLAESRNLLQRSDEGYLLEVVQKIVAEQTTVVEE